MSSEDLLDPNSLPLAATHDEDRVAQLMDASQAMDPSDDAPTSNPPPSQPPALRSQEVGDQDHSASDTKSSAPAPEVTRAPDGSSSEGEHHDTPPADLCAALHGLQVSCKESEAPGTGPPAPAPSSGGEGAPGNDAGATAHVDDALLHPSEGQITAVSVSGYPQPSPTPLAQDNQALASFALHPPPSPPPPSSPPPSLPALDHQQDQGPGWPISHFFSQMMPPTGNGSPDPPLDAYDGMQAPPAGYSHWRMRMAALPAEGMSHAPRDMVSDVAPGRSGGIRFDLRAGRYWYY
ncbi:hypothetical protein EV715DRAFT_292445 [Schizophyllum commune]